MSQIVIKRCPFSPWLTRHAYEVNFALQMDCNLNARIVDGARGEFTVMVDGEAVLHRSDRTLPCVEEIEAAIQKAEPVCYGRKGGDDTDLWVECLSATH